MTKAEMIKIVENHTYTPEDVSAILTAVEAYSSASNNGKPIVSGSLPPDTTGWLIYHNDKVNSVLGAAMRFLNEEQLICLRDCLIERTPKAMTG